MKKPILSNVTKTQQEKGEGKVKMVPIEEITQNLLTITDGWPKRMGYLPFCYDGKEIRWLENPTDFTAWLRTKADLQWPTGSDSYGLSCCSRSELYIHLCKTVDKYNAIEKMPHYPEIENFFYLWSPPTDYISKGVHLEKLLAFFDNAVSDEDKALIKALFLIPAWGGSFGTRPVFFLEADEPGCGKTSLTEAVGLLYDGIVDISTNTTSTESLKTRLLSNDALTKRIVRLDNLKGMLDVADLEALITSRTISGRKLYYGEGSRPNVLTLVVTSNDMRASRDMTQRAFMIRLKKPNYKVGWVEDVRDHIEMHRDFILADIIAELKKPALKGNFKTRWPSFVSEVLSHCTANVKHLIEVNTTRQSDSDIESKQIHVIMATLDEYVNLQPESSVFITSTDLAELLNGHSCFIQEVTPSNATRLLKPYIVAGKLPRVALRKTTWANGIDVRKATTVQNANPTNMQKVHKLYERLRLEEDTFEYSEIDRVNIGSNASH